MKYLPVLAGQLHRIFGCSSIVESSLQNSYSSGSTQSIAPESTAHLDPKFENLFHAQSLVSYKHC